MMSPPIPRETPHTNSVQHSVGDNSTTPPSLCSTEKSPEWINYCRCTCPPPHWGYLPYPSYQHASCLMTAGDYLCQRKSCRFKTPGPLHDQSRSPCAHVQHSQSITRARVAHLITRPNRGVQRCRPIYAKLQALKWILFSDYLRWGIGGGLNHTLASIGQYCFVRWEMTPFLCNYTSDKWPELN